MKKHMYCYLKCIVYDKLLKPRQLFRITLYISTWVNDQDTSWKNAGQGQEKCPFFKASNSAS